MIDKDNEIASECDFSSFSWCKHQFFNPNMIPNSEQPCYHAWVVCKDLRCEMISDVSCWHTGMASLEKWRCIKTNSLSPCKYVDWIVSIAPMHKSIVFSTLQIDSPRFCPVWYNSSSIYRILYGCCHNMLLWLFQLASTHSNLWLTGNNFDF